MKPIEEPEQKHYFMPKGNTILKWTFQSRNLPPHVPIVLCKVVTCWSLYACFQDLAWLGHGCMVGSNTGCWQGEHTFRSKLHTNCSFKCTQFVIFLDRPMGVHTRHIAIISTWCDVNCHTLRRHWKTMLHTVYMWSTSFSLCSFNVSPVYCL